MNQFTNTIVINDYSNCDHYEKGGIMEKKLLLLGILLSHDMHGYQLNEMLQHNPGMPITLKKSNAYKLLGDMEKDGWVTFAEEKEGNRPPRRVYTVTEAGEAAFYRLLRDNLSTCPSPEFPGVVGLDFVYTLPVEEVITLLEQRHQAIEAKFQQLDGVSAEIRQSHLAVEYLHHYYATELQWLADVINRLRAV
jgi:DNA-binding PadR family transcriptional regulator